MATDPAPNVVCPLCGGANACAPAHSGRFGEACWCESAAFSAALLDRVPEALRGVSCICAACAASAADAAWPANGRAMFAVSAEETITVAGECGSRSSLHDDGESIPVATTEPYFREAGTGPGVE